MPRVASIAAAAAKVRVNPAFWRPNAAFFLTISRQKMRYAQSRTPPPSYLHQIRCTYRT